ncbi:ferredoxin [Pelagibius sp. CAU 1746]|uniref:ferredoxin n=1 Tax=Pelagibius sp. CAU 1746 TaxID=3140370 RepID=UPI00325A4488
MSIAAGAVARIEAAAGPQGLILRGAFHCDADDEVPPLADGRESRTLVLLGNHGGGLWAQFQAAAEARDGRPDPLNRWSERVIGALAREAGGQALFPFGGPPYLPFLRWAQRAEAVAPSPLGMLIHPDYGLWHAYRGAVALPEALELPARDERPRPCESCAERPCLTACPVGAFTAAGYEVTACAEHVAAPAGIDCLSRGCQARRACPVGRSYRYTDAQMRFHMEAFISARRP